MPMFTTNEGRQAWVIARELFDTLHKINLCSPLSYQCDHTSGPRAGHPRAYKAVHEGIRDCLELVCDGDTEMAERVMTAAIQACELSTDLLDDVVRSVLTQRCDERGRHRPDDDPEEGNRCKDCGRKIVWLGPSDYDWEVSA